MSHNKLENTSKYNKWQMQKSTKCMDEEHTKTKSQTTSNKAKTRQETNQQQQQEQQNKEKHIDNSVRSSSRERGKRESMCGGRREGRGGVNRERQREGHSSQSEGEGRWGRLGSPETACPSCPSRFSCPQASTALFLSVPRLFHVTSSTVCLSCR